jgi:hypothetical protein
MEHKRRRPDARYGRSEQLRSSRPWPSGRACRPAGPARIRHRARQCRCERIRPPPHAHLAGSRSRAGPEEIRLDRQGSEGQNPAVEVASSRRGDRGSGAFCLRLPSDDLHLTTDGVGAGSQLTGLASLCVWEEARGLSKVRCDRQYRVHCVNQRCKVGGGGTMVCAHSNGQRSQRRRTDSRTAGQTSIPKPEPARLQGRWRWAVDKFVIFASRRI